MATAAIQTPSTAAAAAAARTGATKAQGGSTIGPKQFPWKLHEMLDAAEQNGEDHIVSWMPNGRRFKVHDRELFVKGMMTVYFNQSKYKSFQRQLNLWGFDRATTGDASIKGSYSHPLFLKGRRDLCPCMTRQRTAGGVGGHAHNAQIKNTTTTEQPALGGPILTPAENKKEQPKFSADAASSAAEASAQAAANQPFTDLQALIAAATSTSAAALSSNSTIAERLAALTGAPAPPSSASTTTAAPAPTPTPTSASLQLQEQKNRVELEQALLRQQLLAAAAPPAPSQYDQLALL